MTAEFSYTSSSQSVINHDEIAALIEGAKTEDRERIQDVLQKAKELKGLSLGEAAALLTIESDDLLHALFHTAAEVKDEIYGKRLVLFAPLYISNFCSNACLYCAFNTKNPTLKRRALSQSEIRDEVSKLLEVGHKRVLLVAGESKSKSSLEYVLQSIDTIYDTGDKNRIRRVNVNIAPLTVEQFKELKEHRLGTYQLFQETYHEPTYRKMHIAGPKTDYRFRLEVMDRAMAAGIHDVGIGALFGLYDYRFEVLAMLQHASHLESLFGAGPHTISVPRIEPAHGSDVAEHPPHMLSDQNFAKVIAVLRLAVPYTGIILSTRESASTRKEALALGVSQISAGSRTNPGGYCEAEDEHAGPQFQLGDHRSLEEVIRDCLEAGYLPSFCTGCYRKGRTGKDFMDLAKPGLIKHYCLPNAILTLKEYLVDFASEETKRLGMEVIKQHMLDIPTDKRREQTEAKLVSIEEEAVRDLYF
jgi:2-iminoacetate synthase